MNCPLSDAFEFTDEIAKCYLDEKRSAGLADASLSKLKTPLGRLSAWLGDDRILTAERLLLWRKYIESINYSKDTVQGYVKVINNMLRHFGQGSLCIPKAMQADISGRCFGYLTAVEPTEKRRRTDVIWKCICKCGKEFEAPATELINMHTTSCGCLNKEILKYTNRYVDGTSLIRSMKEDTASKRSASGYTGVTMKNGKWQAYIYYKKKRYNLGSYSTIEEAAKARARGKAWVMDDAKRLYEETSHLYGEMPKRPQKPQKSGNYSA